MSAALGGGHVVRADHVAHHSVMLRVRETLDVSDFICFSKGDETHQTRNRWRKLEFVNREDNVNRR